jgi:2-polyprenyl-6-methoxyphenol hydroxylase-like FAD-dependent oxidoreductase
VILKGTFGEIRDSGAEHWIAQIADFVTPDLAAHLRTHASAVEKPFLLDSASDCVESWSTPGALVIGDAAHTMSPVGGQALNVALRDAIVTANHLVPLFDAPLLDPAALVAIERERMAEVAPIQRLQAVPPRLALNGAWWGEPLRHLLGHFVSTSFGQGVAMSRLSIFTKGVTDVTLEV